MEIRWLRAISTLAEFKDINTENNFNMKNIIVLWDKKIIFEWGPKRWLIFMSEIWDFLVFFFLTIQVFWGMKLYLSVSVRWCQRRETLTFHTPGDLNAQIGLLINGATENSDAHLQRAYLYAFRISVSSQDCPDREFQSCSFNSPRKLFGSNLIRPRRFPTYAFPVRN
jgi:hypothetical protein